MRGFEFVISKRFGFESDIDSRAIHRDFGSQNRRYRKIERASFRRTLRRIAKQVVPICNNFGFFRKTDRSFFLLFLLF